MKETVNVNIGSQAFTLDEDAYRVLRSYLDDIRSRLPEYDTETMGDIEVRIAEIFREIVSSPMRVITLDTVRTAMHRMGAPSDFGERRGNTARQEDEEAEPETRKLYRSRTDRSIAGICGGLADFFHVDATVMRLLMLFLIIFGGLSIWAYIILWIIIPEQPAPKFNINRKQKNCTGYATASSLASAADWPTSSGSTRRSYASQLSSSYSSAGFRSGYTSSSG